MRLLAIDPGEQLWGSERAFLATVPSLSQLNKQLVVMIPRRGELRAALEMENVPTITGPIAVLNKKGTLARVRAVASIVSACRTHRIEHIYLNQAGLCRITHAAALLLSVPLTIHVRLVEDIPRCAALRATAKAPISLVFISQDMRRRYPAAKSNEPHKRLFTAYDPFELTTSSSISQPSEGGLFGCVGRIARIKGQVRLVQGLAAARKSLPRVSLDIIGAAIPGDPYEGELVASIAAHDLAAHVRLLGYRPDIDSLMASYRFIVVPSLYEPLGRVVFEAWNAGLVPICSTDSGGAAEVLIASGGGLLYEGHEPTAIGNAIVRATQMSEAERQRLVSNGRAWAKANLSMIAYTRAMTGVLFPTDQESKVAV